VIHSSGPATARRAAQMSALGCHSAALGIPASLVKRPGSAHGRFLMSRLSRFHGLRLPDPMLSRPGPLPVGFEWSFELKWNEVPRDRRATAFHPRPRGRTPRF